MGAKIRSDSLYARLSPEQREELFVLLVECQGPYEEALRILETWGVHASSGSLSTFVNKHGMAWRLRRAAELAADAEGRLPSGWEKSQKLALAQKEYELSFRDLSLKEYVSLRALQIEEKSAAERARLEREKLELTKKLKTRQLDLKSEEVSLARKKFQRETCKLHLEWSENERAKAIAAGSGSQEEKIEALGRAMFDDWDEE